MKKLTLDLRRLLAAALVLVMIFSLAPAPVMAEENDYTVTVKDENGDPVEGARVSFGGISALTGEDGTAYFDSEELIDNGSDVWSVTKDGYRGAATDYTTVTGPEHREFTIVKIVPITVSGKVTSDGTTGVEGATVTLGLNDLSTTTGADGSYSFENVIVNTAADYTISVSEPGYQAYSEWVHLDNTDVTHNITLTAIPKISISGTVKDGENGVSGATVTLAISGGITAITDENGSFSLTGVTVETADDYALTVTANNYRSSSVIVHLDDADVTVPDITLTAIPKVSVSGTVTDGTDPVEGATVSINVEGGIMAPSEEDGSFTISNIPVAEAGYFTITATKSGYKKATDAVLLDDTDKSGVILALEAKPSVTPEFANASLTLQYGQSATNAVTNGEGRTVSYASADETVATVNATTGEVTATGLGNTTITATFAETDTHAESSASYPVTVGKADPLTLSFTNGATPSVTKLDPRNSMSYTNAVTGLPGDGWTVSYAITEDTDSIVTTINASTGELTISGPGTVTVTATASNDNYTDGSTGSYTLTVSASDFAPDSSVYTLTGTQVNGWYTSDVYLNSATAGAYSFRYQDDAMNIQLSLGATNTSDETWADSLLISMVGKEGTPDGILTDLPLWVKRNSDGAIAALTMSDEVKHDGTPPEGTLTIETRDSWISTLLYIISFGTRADQTSPAYMTIKAKDAYSNVIRIDYYFSKTDEGTDGKTILTLAQLQALPEGKWINYSATMPSAANQYTTNGVEVETTKNAFFSAYARLTDTAGNIAYVSSSGTILDTTLPTATITKSDGTELQSGIAYGSDVALTITANDADGHSGLAKVEYKIVKDFDPETYTETDTGWTTLFTDTNLGEYTATEADLEYSWSSDSLQNNRRPKIVASQNESESVVVKVKVTDRADNSSITTSPAMIIDPSAATVTVHYGTATAGGRVDNVPYFPNSRSITVTINKKPSRFNPDNVTFTVTKDGAPVTGEALNAMFDSADWTTSGRLHSRTINFTEDGLYSFSVSYLETYSGPLGSVDVYADVTKEGAVTDESFVIDTVAPTGTITATPGAPEDPTKPEDWRGTWRTRIWRELLNTLSFGLWDNMGIALKGSFNDATSPVLSYEYYISEETEPLTAEDLDELTDDKWTAVDISGVNKGQIFDIEIVRPSQNMVVYARIKDAAGRSVIISTNGMIVENIESAVKLEIESTPVGGYYSADVPIKITVKEKPNGDDVYSGIRSIRYWIECDGEKMPEELLYLFEVPAPATPRGDPEVDYSDLLTEWEDRITVDAAAFNSDDVKVTVAAMDNAGNITEESVELKINSTVPTIDVSFDNNSPAYNNFYDAPRTATIVITCRGTAFDADAATKGVVVTAVDGNGKALDSAWTLSDWTTTEGATPDETTHTATVSFGEGNYTFNVSYTNTAGTKATVKYADGTTDPNAFSVDATAPTGKLTMTEVGSSWEKLLDFITFGIHRKDQINVKAEIDDVMTEIRSFEYYVADGVSAMSDAQLEALTGWKTKTDIKKTVEFLVERENPNQRFTVYVRVKDMAGNTLYLSTDGAVLDDTLSNITLTPAEKPNDNGLYSGDVKVNIAVEDTDANGAHSGIKSIVWWSEAKGADGEGSSDKPTELYSFKAPAQVQYSDLLKNWKGTITLSAAKNNSNDVKLYVRVTDNAGNVSTKSLALKIDVTAPEAKLEKPTGYQASDQTVTLTINERNFDPALVVITATKNGEPYEIKPTWKTTAGTGNGDDTKNVGTIVFGEDGDFVIKEIVITDLAGNETKVDLSESGAGGGGGGVSFTVDKTAPTVTIVYNNNDVTNNKYYKASRTATITVTETNFDEGTVTITAFRDGAAVKLPTLSAWTHQGDKHTASITFEDDADYTFTFNCKDKSGNKLEKVEPAFTVDQTKPIVEISGIEDESANNSSGAIGFEIKATDTNFDVFQTNIVVTVVENGETKQTLYTGGTTTDIHNGKVFTVENLETDGIYRVTVIVVDKAGNAYEKVIFTDADGNQTEKDANGNSPALSFSVNRGGSTFELDETTQNIVKQYYVQYVYDDIAVIEVNVDELDSYEVTVNGRKLEEGKDYIVNKEGGDGNWIRYTYYINKDLFEEEGEYNVVVSSSDKAKNDAFNDVKDAGVTFVVDRTPPVVTVSGMENGGRYQTEAQTITLIPTDDGGLLASLKVVTVDENGEILETLVDLSGEELFEALEANDGKITFELGEGLFQNVRIICTDCAVDEEGNVNTLDESFTEVSVSSSPLKIFWANRPLRYGVLGGVAGLGILFFFLLFKRRKKDEDEEGKK